MSHSRQPNGPHFQRHTKTYVQFSAWCNNRLFGFTNLRHTGGLRGQTVKNTDRLPYRAGTIREKMPCALITIQEKTRDQELWSRDKWETFCKRYPSNRSYTGKEEKTEITRIFPENGILKGHLDLHKDDGENISRHSNIYCLVQYIIFSASLKKSVNSFDSFFR